MRYTTAELKKILKDFYNINKAVKEGRYFKIGHGLYSDVNHKLDELEEIFAKYPNAILSMQSAFAFYELSDYIPNKYYVVTNQKAHKIENSKVQQIYVSSDIHNIGKQVVKTKYGYINIYDKERMLIELFRLKSKFDYSYFKEVIASYRELAQKHELDSHKIVEYCSMFKRGTEIRNRIQEVVL